MCMYKRMARKSNRRESKHMGKASGNQQASIQDKIRKIVMSTTGQTAIQGCNQHKDRISSCAGTMEGTCS